MSCDQRTFRLEITGSVSRPVQWFDTADEAMRAVNRLCAERVRDFVIEDSGGRILSLAQLAGECRVAPTAEAVIA